MAIVTLAGVVLGDVGEVREVIGVLASTMDVAYLVLTDQLLRTVRTGLNSHQKETFGYGRWLPDVSGGWFHDPDTPLCFIPL